MIHALTCPTMHRVPTKTPTVILTRMSVTGSRISRWTSGSMAPPSCCRRYAFSPLHKNVPKAALADPRLYELLALVDALRDGKARERELAARELSKRLEASPDALAIRVRHDTDTEPRGS